MPSQVTRVNEAVSDWEMQARGACPELRKCLPVIKEKANQILREIDLFQTAKLPDHMFETRLLELNMYGVVCIGRKDDLPKEVDKAIVELEREIAIKCTTFDMKQVVTDWKSRFIEKNTKEARDCSPLVQGKANEILGQLKQMKDLSPDDLSKVGDKGVQYLDRYAQRCLQDGPKAVPQRLPQALRSEPAPISFFMPKSSGEVGF